MPDSKTFTLLTKERFCNRFHIGIEAASSILQTYIQPVELLAVANARSQVWPAIAVESMIYVNFWKN